MLNHIPKAYSCLECKVGAGGALKPTQARSPKNFRTILNDQGGGVTLPVLSTLYLRLAVT